MNMCVVNTRYSAMQGVSGEPELRETRARSGAGGHVGGGDVVRVAVEVLAGPVVTHRGARVGVGGGDLDISQVHARVKIGRERFTNRVEYLGLRYRELRLLVLVDALLPLPLLHQAVPRCNRTRCHIVARGATWTCYSSLTWRF